jgi:hypothetical protein
MSGVEKSAATRGSADEDTTVHLDHATLVLRSLLHGTPGCTTSVADAFPLPPPTLFETGWASDMAASSLDSSALAARVKSGSINFHTIPPATAGQLRKILSGVDPSSVQHLVDDSNADEMLAIASKRDAKLKRAVAVFSDAKGMFV